MKSRWLTVPLLAGVMFLAPSSGKAADNLFVPTAAQFQAGIDQTAPFSGGAQLSTIESITPTELGVTIDAIFRVGEADDGDPFTPPPTMPGETFSRIAFTHFFEPDAVLTAFDGLTFLAESDIDIQIQPFVLTDDAFVFFQTATGPQVVPAGTPTDIVFDFSNAENFSGIPGSEVTALDVVQAFGFQAFIEGEPPAVGEELPFSLALSGAIPEPGSLTLLVISGVGLCVRRGRKS